MGKMAKKKKDLTLREHLKTIQSDGGKARWANLTPEERSAQARFLRNLNSLLGSLSPLSPGSLSESLRACFRKSQR